MTTERDPIDLAAQALRHRDRSRRQVDERLASAGVDEDRRREALETLERVGYVDDGRFASARAASRAARGYGDEAIRHLLDGDGVEASLVHAAVAALEPERERAEALVRAQGWSPRTAAQLARKGFSADVVEALHARAAER